MDYIGKSDKMQILPKEELFGKSKDNKGCENKDIREIWASGTFSNNKY